MRQRQREQRVLCRLRPDTRNFGDFCLLLCLCLGRRGRETGEASRLLSPAPTPPISPCTPGWRSPRCCKTLWGALPRFPRFSAQSRAHTFSPGEPKSEGKGLFLLALTSSTNTENHNCCWLFFFFSFFSIFFSLRARAAGITAPPTPVTRSPNLSAKNKNLDPQCYASSLPKVQFPLYDEFFYHSDPSLFFFFYRSEPRFLSFSSLRKFPPRKPLVHNAPGRNTAKNNI